MLKSLPKSNVEEVSDVMSYLFSSRPIPVDEIIDYICELIYKHKKINPLCESFITYVTTPYGKSTRSQQTVDYPNKQMDVQ